MSHVTSRFRPDYPTTGKQMHSIAGFRQPSGATPPRWLARGLIAARLVAADAVWEPLSGGRTNMVWKVSTPGAALVCKLFLKDINPLFPNDPRSEFRILNALEGMDLAPRPQFLTRIGGHDVLGYDFVPTSTEHSDATQVAELLGRLHQVDPPVLPDIVPSGSDALGEQLRAIMAECSSLPPGFPRDMPLVKVAAVTRNALIHRDVVPGNIIATRKGPMLIDWQCPALGDPAEDLASFLSPAMQYLYAGRPLPKATETAFLDAYPHPATVERYLALRPLFHLRMVAYCHWRAERGADGYARARDLELSALRQLQRDDQQAGGDDAEAEISG